MRILFVQWMANFLPSRYNVNKFLSTMIAACLIMGMAIFFPAQALADDSACGSQSSTTLTGHAGEGSVSATGTCSVVPTDIAGDAGTTVLVVDCGYATATDDHNNWNKDCGPTGVPCPPVPGNPSPHQFITTLALTRPVIPIAQWCAGTSTPTPSSAALRDEVVRLLHAPAIGISPNTGTGLVNLKTLYWITTPTTVNLGVASLVGFPVQLRVNYLRTEFDFGDGDTAALQPGPGTPYDPTHDCGKCTTQFGHSYDRTGRVTVTARTYWQAEFQVSDHPWITIPGDITAAQPATTTLVVAQSHNTLVSPR